MSENNLDNPGPRRFSRRRAIGGAVAVGVTTALALAGCDLPGTQTEVEEPESLPPAILEDTVTINLDLAKFRLDPHKLDSFEKDKDGHVFNTNIVNHAEIETLNNASVSGKQEADIENPEIVWGRNPDGSDKPSPWIRFRAVKRLALVEPLKKRVGYIYLPLSKQTEQFAKPKSSNLKFANVKGAEGDKIITDGGSFVKNQIGRITFPKAA